MALESHMGKHVNEHLYTNNISSEVEFGFREMPKES